MMPITREHLSSLPRRRLHAGRNFTKGIVDIVTLGDRDVVIKDVAVRPWPVRELLGPWQLDRESRAYRALAGLPGVPAFLGRIDRQAIALEYVPGRNLGDFRRGELGNAFFDRLDRLLEAMHERGVAHGDLHRHDVLAGPDGSPFVVDYSTSVSVSERTGPVLRFLFRQMCRADLRSSAKLRRRFLAGPAAGVPERPGLYRAGRWARRFVRLRRR